jgi:hypothetical protein
MVLARQEGAFLAEDTLMAPQRLSAETWLRAAIIRVLLGTDEFVPDLSAAVDEAEAMIVGEGVRSGDRLYARFVGWQQARGEGIRLAFVMAERINQITALIQPNRAGEPVTYSNKKGKSL